ncbi:hypothetical protein TELCIR_22322, partial [Teladorsagia circumcincta]
MRLLLLTLLLVVAVNGGIFDKVKGIFTGEGSFGQKVKNATIVGFKKKWRPIRTDKVDERGDSITEVNENSRVAKELYQGDVVLTEQQAEEIVEDIEDEVAGGNRTKRQAFKDHRYPKMLWSQGVNYYFHNLADAKMRNAFIKGAKLWEKDTCINFTQNRF